MAPRAQATQATARLARMPSGGVGACAPNGIALDARSRALRRGGAPPKLHMASARVLRCWIHSQRSWPASASCTCLCTERLAQTWARWMCVAPMTHVW